MSAPSDDLNDLQSDIGNLAHLLTVLYSQTTEQEFVVNGVRSSVADQICALAMIARDLGENLNATMDACHNKVLADARAKGGAVVRENQSTEAFDVVTSMEDGISTAKDFASLLAMAAEALSGEESSAVQTIAWAIRDHLVAIEEQRGTLFRLIHPNREAFDKTGWPGGAA
ncbi:hypothetical protein [Mesorhizobium sp. M0870]|uniref:hypothetical protein n=1 Tax=Mesorhizobium sp. M0870 TaxID=2957016 RepID=UPI003336774A